MSHVHVYVCNACVRRVLPRNILKEGGPFINMMFINKNLLIIINVQIIHDI